MSVDYRIILLEDGDWYGKKPWEGVLPTYMEIEAHIFGMLVVSCRGITSFNAIEIISSIGIWYDRVYGQYICTSELEDLGA
jgi:hypothetical protein